MFSMRRRLGQILGIVGGITAGVGVIHFNDYPWLVVLGVLAMGLGFFLIVTQVQVRLHLQFSGSLSHASNKRPPTDHN